MPDSKNSERGVFLFFLPNVPPPTLNADGVSWLSRQAGATVHPMCKRTPHAASGSHSQDKASWTPPLRPPTTANGNATDRGFQFLHAQSSAPLISNPTKKGLSGAVPQASTNPALRVFSTPTLCGDVPLRRRMRQPRHPATAMKTTADRPPGSPVNQEMRSD